MIKKEIGGWFFGERIYAKIKLSNELWFYRGPVDTSEIQYQLFFVGWYQRLGGNKLYTLALPFVVFKLGWGK